MDYRLATEGDVAELSRMRWDFRAEAGEAPCEDAVAFSARYAAFVRAGLASGSWFYWVASDAGHLVAHMAICIVQGVPRPSRTTDRWGYLTDVYTRPSHRGAGIGGELLARVRAWAAAQDLELLLAWPSEDSTAFYARGGFAPANDVVVLSLRPFDAPNPGTR